MNKLFAPLLAAVAVLALLIAVPDEAFAKRLGGGKSFGSRPSYSEPYRAPADAGSMARGSQPGYQQSAATQRNQAMRDSFRNRGGLMGMLGGLALGGLLGALFFGGAFEHVNLLDMIIFALVAFLLFRFLAARRQGQWTPAQGGATRPGYSFERADVPLAGASNPATRPVTGAGFETNVLFGKRSAGAYKEGGSVSAVPADFDTDAFLMGAKNAYRHLQSAWDAADLAELRALTTDQVFAELRDQLRQRTGVNRTEILTLDARLLEVREVGAELQSSVLFDGLVRESAEEDPQAVREVWHFTRNRNSRQPTWFLDGIQQCHE